MCNFIIIIITLFSINVNSFDAIRTPKPKCNQPLNIYDNIGCIAKYCKNDKSDKELCPDWFDCSQIDPNINKCYYRGKYYAIGEQIGNDVDVPTCYTGCFCNEDLTFVCAIYDCIWPEIPNNCYHTYGLNQCCPTGYKCPDNSTLKCDANGNKVYEGQTFVNPKDKCSQCECAVGVTGKPGDPHCRKNVCHVEIFQSNYILSYCAAVYDAFTNYCCPNDYICPRDDDIFLSSCNSVGSEEDNPVGYTDGNALKQCRYGKQYHDIGTRFIRKELYSSLTKEQRYLYIRCECVIPPYFTCLKDSQPQP